MTSPSTLPESLADLLLRQDGILTRDQLRSCGISRGQERAELDGGRWQALNDVAICTHNGPLTLQQAEWATVLSASPPAALCGVTVLEARGVSGFAVPAVHMVMVRGSKVLRVPGVRLILHESRRFTAEDIDPLRSPPMTTLERATIDSAVWSPDVRTATRIVVAAVQQRRTTADRLSLELHNAGQVRYRRVLLAVLADIGGGLRHSPSSPSCACVAVMASHDRRFRYG